MVILFYPTLTGWRNALPKEGPKEICKEKIETDKRRKHFFHTFLYLLGEWTNQRYVPRHSVVPKNTRRQNRCCRFDVTTRKRGRFTENLSIYLSPPAPNSPLQNPSNFGATASHWLLYILLFFFFFYFNRMDAWSLMRGDAFIHFVSGSRRVNIRLGVFLLIPKSPQETGFQSQVKLNQRLKKCYLMLPCLTLGIIRKGSRVKWNNLGNGVAISPTPRCSSYWKESLRVAPFNYVANLHKLNIVF